MTHWQGYRAAAVAHAGDLAGIGIDAEPHEALPDGVGWLVTTGEDRRGPARAGRAGQPSGHPPGSGLDYYVRGPRWLETAREACASGDPRAGELGRPAVVPGEPTGYVLVEVYWEAAGLTIAGGASKVLLDTVATRTRPGHSQPAS